MKAKMITTQVDEALALKRVKGFDEEIEEVLALVPKGGKLVLNDEGAYLGACDILLDVKVRQKALAEERDGFMAEVKKLVDRVNGWFKAPIEKHARAEEVYKDAIRAYCLHVEAQAQGLRQAAGKLPEKDEEKREELLRSRRLASG